MQFLESLDLNGREIKDVRVESFEFAALPSAAANEGRIVYDTTNKAFLYSNGSEWVNVNKTNIEILGSGKIKMSKSASVGIELNLLGKTSDEAVSELDKYLDDAYIAHLPSVRIVHGKGTGALRKAVHNYLRRCKIVDEYHLGEFGEGDAGVTIVTFKK